MLTISIMITHCAIISTKAVNNIPKNNNLYMQQVDFKTYLMTIFLRPYAIWEVYKCT